MSELKDVAEDVEVECGKCAQRVHMQETPNKFAFCGCDNRARLGFVGSDQEVLIGAQDEKHTFVHLKYNNVVLPRITLKRWNQLKQKFQTQGSLLPIPLPQNQETPKK
jgi:hypothetical protein